jgi:hypothetical protein
MRPQISSDRRYGPAVSLAFKSSVDSDRRAGQFYAELRRIYFGLAVALVLIALILVSLLPPSELLGFGGIAQLTWPSARWSSRFDGTKRNNKCYQSVTEGR